MGSKEERKEKNQKKKARKSEEKIERKQERKKERQVLLILGFRLSKVGFLNQIRVVRSFKKRFQARI